MSRNFQISLNIHNILRSDKIHIELIFQQLNLIKGVTMLMANGLKRYFPMIRDKAEILNDIYESAALTAVYKSWNEEQQEKFKLFQMHLF